VCLSSIAKAISPANLAGPCVLFRKKCLASRPQISLLFV